jgi:hypothetical protein
MKLNWFDPSHSSILATLDEGETLGPRTGPGVFLVPADPNNEAFKAIEADQHFKIGPPEPAPAAPQTAPASTSVTPMDTSPTMAWPPPPTV